MRSFAIAWRTRGARTVAVLAGAEAAAATAATTAEAAAITATAAEAAAIAATEATPVAAAAEPAAIAIAAIVAVALAHLDGGLGLVLVDAHGDEADDVGRQTHAALHLGHRRRRGVDVQERVVGLAVLLDLEGDGLDAPVLGLADLSSAFLDDCGVFLRQGLDLGLRNVLARQEHMLIERHAVPFLLPLLSIPAHSPFWAPCS